MVEQPPHDEANSAPPRDFASHEERGGDRGGQRWREARPPPAESPFPAPGPGEPDVSGPMPREVLVFELGPHRLGLPVERLREIVRAVAVTRLPSAPEIVEGVINYRGKVAPVLDVRARFSLPPEPLHPSQHFLIARTLRRTVALRVDRASHLLTLDPEAWEGAREGVPGVGHVLGLTRLEQGVLVIQDLDRFLSLEEESHLDRLEAEGTLTEAGGSSDDSQAGLRDVPR